MSGVRRVYYYLVTLITLGILAGGAGVLLSLLFDITISNSTAAIGQANFHQQQFSLGLAMLVIGGPLWFFFWKNVQKYVVGSNIEIGSTLRKFFLNFILVVTSLTAVYSAQTFFKWLLTGIPQSPSSSSSLATLIVALAVWYFHWRVSEREGQPSPSSRTLRRWYMYLDSGWGMVLLTIGLVQLIDLAVKFLPVWGNVLVMGSFWAGAFQDSLILVVLGSLLWAFHWFRMAKRDFDSTLRQVYIYLLAIVGSSIAGLTALTIGLYRILVWLMGTAGTSSISYFQFIGWLIPLLFVTAALWTYHQTVAREESAQVLERLLSSKRVHLYIMSFIGLGTLTSGLIILFGTILDLIINSLNPAIAVQSGWWQKQLSLALSLLIVGSPLWWYYWNQIIHLSSGGGVVEGRAKSRRIYLYVIIGASIIALAAVLVNILYQLLSGLLAGSFGLSVLEKSKWSIQALLVAVPLLLYHWQIARDDQHRGAEAAAEHKNVTALIDNSARTLLGSLEDQLGLKIRVMEFEGIPEDTPTLSAEDVVALVNQIKNSPSQYVMLIVHGGKLMVLPYQPK